MTEVAARMLRARLELGPAEATDRLARHYGVDGARIRADLDRFVGDLLKQGMLSPVGSPPRSPRLRERFASLVISLLVRLMRLRPSLSGKAAGLMSAANLSCRWLGWVRTVRLWQCLFTPPRQLLVSPAAEAARAAIDHAVRQGRGRT